MLKYCLHSLCYHDCNDEMYVTGDRLMDIYMEDPESVKMILVIEIKNTGLMVMIKK